MARVYVSSEIDLYEEVEYTWDELFALIEKEAEEIRTSSDAEEFVQGIENILTLVKEDWELENA